jgi:hypothetical protein
MQSLDDTDRTALLLRFFDNKSLREVGAAIGLSEDAAQKRVSRGLERLRAYFNQRKVAVGASALAALISANALEAAPAGLAGTIATGAVMALSAVSTSTAVSVTKTIVMTTIQKTIIAVAAAGAVGLGLYQSHRLARLRDQVQTLQQQEARQPALLNQLEELRRERDRATNALASLAAQNAGQKKNPNEVLKLRGEVGRLRQQNADIGSTNAMSKVTASPEMRKMLRDTQKLGMAAIYKGFAQLANLSPEQTDKFNDLLADNVMDNVDHITGALRDKSTREQIDQVFASQDAALQDKLQALLGADGLAQYQDYTKNLLGTLTAQQFTGMLTGDDTAKGAKADELSLAVQNAAQAALASAGLPADYQTVPILNFGNIASEQESQQSLDLLNDIYQRVAARASSFLSPDEIGKFQQFTTTAINNSRAVINMNRTLMAPISN